MYSTRLAYLFLIPSFFGMAGLQRFYLGKIGSGIIYFLTGGLLGIGTLYDLITLPEQVRILNKSALIERWASSGTAHRTADILFDREPPRPLLLETIILRTAEANAGIVSVSEIALKANVTTEKAQKELDGMVEKGRAELRVRQNGTTAYVIPDFLPDTQASEFEDL